ncbi:MAG: hypothetical protein LBM09_00915 [Candidatus Nomurabacteria bacterium]|jgi:hypothetical protein|nr:hypothetical protein [Candidatus Nomurabacteria bacterium]
MNNTVNAMLQSVRSHQYPMNFDESLWRYKQNPELQTDTNCFLYGFGIDVPVKDHKFGYPGTATSPYHIPYNWDQSCDQQVIERIKKDAEFYGFTTTTAIGALQLVVMVKHRLNFLHDTNDGIRDVHIVRRDADGGYSEKNGWNQNEDALLPRRVEFPDGIKSGAQHGGYTILDVLNFEPTF